MPEGTSLCHGLIWLVVLILLSNRQRDILTFVYPQAVLFRLCTFKTDAAGEAERLRCTPAVTSCTVYTERLPRTSESSIPQERKQNKPTRRGPGHAAALHQDVPCCILVSCVCTKCHWGEHSRTIYSFRHMFPWALLRLHFSMPPRANRPLGPEGIRELTTEFQAGERFLGPKPLAEELVAEGHQDAMRTSMHG